MDYKEIARLSAEVTKLEEEAEWVKRDIDKVEKGNNYYALIEIKFTALSKRSGNSKYPISKGAVLEAMEAYQNSIASKLDVAKSLLGALLNK